MTETITPDYADAYRSLRGRVIELVGSSTPEQLERVSPATPDWRVRDVLAHMVGVTSDVLAGNLDGVATDPWTQAQVESRRERPVTDLIDEWEANGALIDPMIVSFGPVAGQFIVDATTHEHDIRLALDAAGARDSTALDIAFPWMLEFIGTAREGAGAGAMRVQSDAGSFVAGVGEPTATCSADRFEVFRAMTGRRSLEQISAWDWSGEARPELVVLAIFQPRPEPLVE